MGCNAPIRRSATLAVLVCSLAGVAVAQPQPRTEPGADRPVLRGPSVEDSSIPGTARAFSMTDGMDGPQSRMLNREIPMGEFLGAIRALNAPEAPEEIRLTPDQRAALGRIVIEQTDATREYMAQNRDELMALGEVLGFDPMELARAERAFGERLAEGERRAGRAGDSEAGDGPAGDRRRSPEQMIRERVGENPTPEQRSAMQRLREIRAAGPNMLEAQTRAWNLLSEPQQAFAQAQLERARARQEALRGEMYLEERAQRADGGDRPGAPRPGAGRGSAAERLHRMIDELEPQEQENLLRILENRLQNRLRGEGAERRPGRPVPAPSIDRVNVPAPTTTDPV